MSSTLIYGKGELKGRCVACKALPDHCYLPAMSVCPECGKRGAPVEMVAARVVRKPKLFGGTKFLRWEVKENEE